MSDQKRSTVLKIINENKFQGINVKNSTTCFINTLKQPDGFCRMNEIRLYNEFGGTATVWTCESGKKFGNMEIPNQCPLQLSFEGFIWVRKSLHNFFIDNIFYHKPISFVFVAPNNTCCNQPGCSTQWYSRTTAVENPKTFTNLPLVASLAGIGM